MEAEDKKTWDFYVDGFKDGYQTGLEAGYEIAKHATKMKFIPVEKQLPDVEENHYLDTECIDGQMKYRVLIHNWETKEPVFATDGKQLWKANFGVRKNGETYWYTAEDFINPTHWIYTKDLLDAFGINTEVR